MDNKIFIASNNVELSESKSYIELTNLLCYYDEPNENGVQLSSEDALEKAQTLINMPVVAKYRCINGKPDLGSHEAYINPVSKKLEFDTDNIGTHISIEVKDTEVNVNGETKTLPCLYATSRIWTQRHRHTIDAIKRLYAEGKLTSSWEISVNGYEYKDGIKILNDYSFDANCLLGSSVLPAYPCASVVDMASLEHSQLMIAEAFTKDKEEVNKMDNTNVNPETTKEEPSAVQSALTWSDLYSKLSKACRDAVPHAWLWLSFVFIDEQKCLCDFEGSSELEFFQFNYSIVDGEVVVSDKKTVKLVVSVKDINTAISSRDEAILSANEKIKTLNSQIEDLGKYKEICEKIEAEKAEAERNEKIEKLKTLAQSGGYISAEEIETNEDIKNMISALDEVGIKSLIVDRIIASKPETPSVETSSVHTDVSNDTETKEVSAYSVYMNLK